MRWNLEPWLAALLATVKLGRAQHVVDLAGDGWMVSSDALNISVPGRLPSQVHLDLLAAKVIGERSGSTFMFMPRSKQDVRGLTLEQVIREHSILQTVNPGD